MTPQVANRLVLAYILVSLVALLLVIMLAGAGWTGAITGDLFTLANALASGGFAYWLYADYVRERAREIGWKKAPVFEVLMVAFLLLLFEIGFTNFSAGLFPRSYHKYIGLPKNLTAGSAWG